MRLWIAGAVVSALSMAGCGGTAAGGTTSPTPGSGSGTSVGTMSATIDGTPWIATTVIATTTPASTGVAFGTLVVSGTGNFSSQAINVTLAVPPVVGVYPLGPGQLAAGAPQNASLTNSSTGARWTATALTGSGTISITSISLTGASGNFAFNLTPVGTTPATGTRVVTEGSFNVSF